VVSLLTRLGLLKNEARGPYSVAPFCGVPAQGCAAVHGEQHRRDKVRGALSARGSPEPGVPGVILCGGWRGISIMCCFIGVLWGGCV